MAKTVQVGLLRNRFSRVYKVVDGRPQVNSIAFLSVRAQPYAAVTWAVATGLTKLQLLMDWRALDRGVCGFKATAAVAQWV